MLIDSRGCSLATGLSISAAFRNYGNVHFVGLNASAATIASLGAAHISIDARAMYLVHKCSMAFFEWGSLNSDRFPSLIADWKFKADRSVATLGKFSRFYDVTNSKEYEVESGPLTSDECLQVEQMLTSSAVRIPYGIYSALYDNDFDVLSAILITDFTSELSDTDEKPNSVKFTWRLPRTARKSTSRLRPASSTTNSNRLTLNLITP